jgi:acyl carrier protein
MESTQLKEELKTKIIQFLNLAPLTPAEIDDEAPLFGEGLGLDSIDSLELIVMLKREYGIQIQDPKEGRKILVNINTMVDYIKEHRTI